MKKLIGSLVLLATLVLLMGGCGYYFPGVYDGPTKTVFMPQWKNRTSKLGIDITLYKNLSRWFQQSDAIILTKDKKSADLALAGEIVSIYLPSAAWGADSLTTDVKVRLVVRYILKDLHTDKVLWEVPSESWIEYYPSNTLGSAAEDEALLTILDDLSERIYLGTLDRIRRENAKAGQQTSP